MEDDFFDLSEMFLNTEKRQPMTEEQIKHLTNRFLGWKLPADFHPDAGISYTRPNYHPSVDATPSGTNLFSADQAEAMVRFMAEGMPERTGGVEPSKCKHIHRRGVGSAGSDGSSSFTGSCMDCGKDLSYKIEGATIPVGLESQLSN